VAEDLVKQVIVIRKDLNMRKGKMIAQGSHASILFLISGEAMIRQTQKGMLNEYYLTNRLTESAVQWIKGNFTKITLSVSSEDELNALIAKAKELNVPVYPITDSGKTEFHGVPTLTCAAFGPEKASIIDQVTGHLTPL
jgi:PTH2 family peptidyl-tRNA hydrolase